ncbi:hypothetical protein N7499_006180 [Penicillium canescens]|uniref:Uncharacterized protein n=1 Tax=Penicillium canescens TaxID=5083 RepID=A0AAD6IDS1_PENCN|nr:hypothetical protein N7460_005116 [Penicillium canescens]KAJ6081306.1 hypothetical protein N7499_006180 [Penicillium canescens]KAJ6176896.1 hypothetical protein N7485_003810 [Penicillium canescens]
MTASVMRKLEDVTQNQGTDEVDIPTPAEYRTHWAQKIDANAAFDLDLLHDPEVEPSESFSNTTDDVLLVDGFLFDMFDG